MLMNLISPKLLSYSNIKVIVMHGCVTRDKVRRLIRQQQAGTMSYRLVKTAYIILGSFVLTQYWLVTGMQTHRQTDKIAVVKGTLHSKSTLEFL